MYARQEKKELKNSVGKKSSNELGKNVCKRSNKESRKKCARKVPRN